MSEIPEGIVFPVRGVNARTGTGAEFSAAVEGDVIHLADHEQVHREPHAYQHEWSFAFKVGALRAAVAQARQGKMGRVPVAAEPHRAPPTFSRKPGDSLHRGVMRIKEPDPATLPASMRGALWIKPPRCPGYLMSAAEIDQVIENAS